MKFVISIFDNKADNLPQQQVRTWPQLCQRFAAPVVRQEKDGTLFSPARFVPTKRRLANVVEVSMLVIDCDHGVESKDQLLKALREKSKELGGAFAFGIYSTHSHLQFVACSRCESGKPHRTDDSGRDIHSGNIAAEPRYRVVIPLALPIPPAQYPLLWDWAASMADLHLDQQTKDASRISYTPVKFCDEAPYEWHVEPGEFLDWRKVIINVGTVDRDQYRDNGDNSHDPSAFLSAASAKPPTASVAPRGLRDHESRRTQCFDGADRQQRVPRTAAKPEAAPQQPGPSLLTYAARHLEFTARIMARAKRNARGVYDARCLAHGGKGETGLLYNPTTHAVKCNSGCTYDQLLLAEGLQPGYLPDVVIAEHRRQTIDDGPLGAAATVPASTVTVARLHVIYSLLLAHCLELKPEDEATILKHWGPDAAYSKESIAWPEDEVTALIKACSMPTFIEGKDAAARLATLFDLRGIPGFFFCDYREGGTLQGSPVWLLNTPRNLKPGALLAPYYSRGGLVIGIRILRSVRDRVPNPWLLTSRGLPFGSHAVAIDKTEAA